MIVIADASPLIFLAKLDLLKLIEKLFGDSVFVPQRVVDEALTPPIPVREEILLNNFLSHKCRVEQIKHPQFFVSAMSCADSEVITLAIRKKADYVLADDRIVRDVALVEGIRPMGTLGIILRAVSEKHISLKKAQDSFNALVRQHNFRISIRVYDAFQEQLRTME